MKPDAHYIVGTAGHVDHGKTTLIRALTGTETDRLKEERQRGISIELGFARLDLGDGQVAGVVDVPGHEKFVPQMLKGISGIDLVLLVVDANEGVMPQTLEHLQIMQLLQVKKGIIVVTKADLVEPEWLDIVEEEIREQVQDTFLQHAPCCRVSAHTGEGLEGLLATVRTQLEQVAARDATGAARLPVDRCFSVSGFGTVVTGTLASGSIKPGESLEILPAGVMARVREAQVHDRPAEQVFAGQRVALNLAGVRREQITQGSVVGTPGLFRASRRIDVQLQLLATLARPLKFREPVHFHIGTGRTVARVVLLDQDELAAGAATLAQLVLDQPLLVHRGDRFIIRSYSPMITIGGGVVVDVAPPKHKRFRPEVIRNLRELATGDLGFWLQKLDHVQIARLKELEQYTGTGRGQLVQGLEQLRAQGRVTQLGEQWLTVDRRRSWQQLLPRLVEHYHQQHPLRHGMPRATLREQLCARLTSKGFEQLLQDLVEAGQVRQHNDLIALPDWAPKPSAEEQAILDRLRQHYIGAGLQVKNNADVLLQLQLSDVDADACFAWLYEEGELIRLNQESSLAAGDYQRAQAALIEHFQQRDSLTLAEFRDRLGCGRKLTQALLEFFDACKLTRRVADHRVPWQLPQDNPSRS